MKIKNGIEEITALKKNEKTMNEEQHISIIQSINFPTNLRNLPKLGEEIITDLDSGKIIFPDQIKRALAKSNDDDGYKLESYLYL